MLSHSTFLSNRLFRGLALAAACWFLSQTVQAEEYSVSPAGGADFLSLQAAVDGSQDGDRILLFPGEYREDLVIASRSLDLVELWPQTVTLSGRVQITNLGPHQSVRVRGLHVIGTGAGGLGAVHGSFNRGRVFLQDVRAEAGDYRAGAHWEHCARVSLVDSHFMGEAPYPSWECGQSGGPGLRAVSSDVAVWNSTCEGGIGDFCSWLGGPLPNGGPGIQVLGSRILMSDSQAHGGDGGIDFNSGPSGNGGDGVAGDSSSLLIWHASLATGGEGGVSFGGAGFDGDPIASAVPMETLVGDPVRSSSKRFVRLGSTNQVTVDGEPGDFVHALVWHEADHFLDYGLQSAGLGTAPWGSLRWPVFRETLGALPATGTLQASMSWPNLLGADSSAVWVTSFWTALDRRERALAKPHLVVQVDCQAVRDCDGNGLGDLCEALTGTSTDCDANGVPDSCQVDCNQNGVPDSCDIQQGTSLDQDGDGIPDECQG